MAEWHCFKCKVKVETATIDMLYMDIQARQDGVRCPKCGAKYILEDVALEKVARAEKMIEQK